MRIILPLLSSLMLLATGCGSQHDKSGKTHPEVNSIYYWKTVYAPDSAEREFITRHDVGRIYLRMFDVTPDNFTTDVENRTVPNATVKFPEDFRWDNDTVRQQEYVPVVYITLDALKAMKGNEGTLARNIVTRVSRMARRHGLDIVNELQLDCDWTASTEPSFFALCDSVKYSIEQSDLSWDLSSTIRLHQLARKAPPVDRGVLMVYNTGNFNDPDAENSIISRKDVEPYLKRLRSYPLHLDVAYPTYSWQLLFRNRQFVGLLGNLNLGDSTLFSRKNDNSYIARKDFPVNNFMIHRGDMVRSETSSYKDIIQVKSLIEQRLSGKPHSNILYHLDSNNLSNYSNDEIAHLYSVGN